MHEEVCPRDGAAATVVDEIPVGSVIGGYRLTGELGDGGMGVVYEANHEVLGRRCAVKLLRPEYATNQEVVTRFLQEAKAVNLIHNKHIVNVYDYGDDIEGLVYFVMELLEGQTLGELMNRYAPMTPPLFCHVFSQVAHGLAAAHEKEIVHRDLKFENIFVISKGNNPLFIKILDFGVAKLRGEQRVEGLTGEGRLIGTPKFMSPEQLRGKAVDTRSDVFSLGIMMYAAATGAMPFGGSDLSEIALGIIKGQQLPLTDHVRDFPPSLSEIINKALEKEPENRFANAREVQDALRDASLALDPDSSKITAALREHLGDPNADVGPAIHTPPPPADERPTAGRPRPSDAPSRGGLKAGLAVAALAVAGGIGFFALSGSGDDTKGKTSTATETQNTSHAGAVAESATLAATLDGPASATRALASQAMLKLWDESSAEVRRGLIASLASVGSPACAPLLVQALKEEAPASEEAARALAEHGSDATKEALFASLEDAGPGLRVAIATTMLEIGDTRATEPLKALLAQPRYNTAAAIALATATGDPDSIRLLTDVLVETPKWKGHWLEAAEALLRVKVSTAETALLEGLEDAEPANRAKAAMALARAGHQRGLDHLGNLVADARAQGRGGAAMVLAALGHSDAELFVPVGLTSDDEQQRVEAAAVLSRLGGDELRKQAKRLAQWTDEDQPAVAMAALAALANLPD